MYSTYYLLSSKSKMKYGYCNTLPKICNNQPAEAKEHFEPWRKIAKRYRNTYACSPRPCTTRNPIHALCVYIYTIHDTYLKDLFIPF